MKAGVVDVLDDELRGGPRPSAGQDEDLVEDLHALDQRQDDDHQHVRPQERKGDPPEDAFLARAVHFRRLVEIRRDRLESGQQDQRVEAHVRPDSTRRSPRTSPTPG